jgi:putative N6-adenine-specific DNA methylase
VSGVPLFLPAAGGTEALLADECRGLLGAAVRVEAGRGGVVVHGDEAVAMRLNLHSRIAQRVLWPLATGGYRDEADLYALARGVRWADWITPRQSLRVATSARHCPLRSLQFAALRVKDAVCDALRATHGARPGVDLRAPDLALLLHLDAAQATLYVDTSGEPLFKRGWRDAAAAGHEVKGEAPLKETLAAAMLAAAGWHGRAGDPPLLDPCCGAGTIAIEAAQLACGIAPGLQRRFAFERLAPFAGQRAAWHALQRSAREQVHAPAVAVFAGDVSFRMTDFAARNAARAGVGAAIEFKTADALQRPPPAPRGVLMLNPPYGERLAPKGSVTAAGEAREAASGGEGDFFAALAAHWKRHYAGWTAWVLSPDARLPARMRLHESRRVPLWNGPIECRLFRFELVAGAHRRAGSAAPPQDPPATA